MCAYGLLRSVRGSFKSQYPLPLLGLKRPGMPFWRLTPIPLVVAYRVYCFRRKADCKPHSLQSGTGTSGPIHRVPVRMFGAFRLTAHSLTGLELRTRSILPKMDPRLLDSTFYWVLDFEGHVFHFGAILKFQG